MLKRIWNKMSDYESAASGMVVIGAIVLSAVSLATGMMMA